MDESRESPKRRSDRSLSGYLLEWAQKINFSLLRPRCFYNIIYKRIVNNRFDQLIMSLHRSIIRHVLSAPMSLADLQAATQVSLPTLRRAVQELTDARWIHVVGQAEANGGRPAMLFGIDSRQFLVVGLHLQLPGMRLIATDLSGQVLDESKRFNGVVPAPSECIPSVVDYLTNLQASVSGSPNSRHWHCRSGFHRLEYRRYHLNWARTHLGKLPNLSTPTGCYGHPCTYRQ